MSKVINFEKGRVGKGVRPLTDAGPKPDKDRLEKPRQHGIVSGHRKPSPNAGKSDLARGPKG